MSVKTSVFGPFRAIGVRYAGKSEHQELMRVWQEFIPRRNEIAGSAGAPAFGVCRCLPGVKDGSFEYIAAFQAAPDAAIPSGMMAVDIPRGEYLVHRFDSSQGYQQAWKDAMGVLNSAPEWTGYCTGPDNCECAGHPCFEYYPPEFTGSGPAYIYLPVRPK